MKGRVSPLTKALIVVLFFPSKHLHVVVVGVGVDVSKQLVGGLDGVVVGVDACGGDGLATWTTVAWRTTLV